MRPHRRTSARSSRALVRSRGRRIGPCSWRGRPVRARELEGGSGCPRPWPWTRPKTQEHPRVQRMIGIGCIAPIQTSNRLRVSAASERGSMASPSSYRGVTPRVGPFFAGHDHTTVLHSVRRMEDRAARDPELHAYMASIKQVRPVGGLPSPSKTRAPHAGKLFSPGLHPRPCRKCFGSRVNESHSRRSVGGRWASNPWTWAKFLVRAVAAELSREKRRRGGMATAGAVRAAKGASQAPARSARPCSATASRSAAGAGAKTSPRPLSPAPALKREERT